MPSLPRQGEAQRLSVAAGSVTGAQDREAGPQRYHGWDTKAWANGQAAPDPGGPEHNPVVFALQRWVG